MSASNVWLWQAFFIAFFFCDSIKSKRGPRSLTYFFFSRQAIHEILCDKVICSKKLFSSRPLWVLVSRFPPFACCNPRVQAPLSITLYLLEKNIQLCQFSFSFVSIQQTIYNCIRLIISSVRMKNNVVASYLILIVNLKLISLCSIRLNN